MEQPHTAPTATKASGITKPSRLPLLRNRSSQTLNRKPSNSLEVQKPVNTTPNLQNRSSIAALPRPSQTVHDNTGSRYTISSGARNGQRSSVSIRSSTVRPSSCVDQQRILPLADRAGPTSEETHDDLGALNDFRSASLQGLDGNSLIEPLECPKNVMEQSVVRERTAPRPSLSDRTIESIQNLPSTPKDRRRSSFFSPVESPMGPPPRPTSSHSRDSSNNSRPSTSDVTPFKQMVRPLSPAKRPPASAKPASRAVPRNDRSFTRDSNQRGVSNTGAVNSQDDNDPSSSALRVISPSRSSVTEVARPKKHRPALGDTFQRRPTKTPHPALLEYKSQLSQDVAEKSPKCLVSPTNASSAALRQQIAAAKAAARKEKVKEDPAQGDLNSSNSTLELAANADPFNQLPKDGKHVLRNRINAARMNGKLDIAALGLKQIPEEVMKMYDASAMEEGKVNWAEVVDVTKFIAADNELEQLDDTVFPDSNDDELDASDQSTGNQFSGLEMLDLHGNVLQSVPLGLRRLERLTSLNLSHNKLDNAALDIVAQIHTLTVLKLRNNSLSGHLPASICQLEHLQTFDLQANRLLGLPEAIRELVSLKVLNVSGNQLTALPMEAIQQLSLIELDASRNALIGSLFSLGGVSAHATLQTLDVSNNSLVALTFSKTLDLPQLQSVNVMNNHLIALPPISGWSKLVTLIAADNKISELPHGFVSLRRLRNANFSNNEIRLLDPEIARMENLGSLIIASNPLRDKKYLTMNTEDVKRDMSSRLEPSEAEADQISDPETVIDLSTGGPASASTSKGTWALKAHGLLDLSNKALFDSVNDTLGSFLKSNEVKQLKLHANKLTAVPPALRLAQDLRTLDLSGNVLGSEYLSDGLELPALLELNLSNCGLLTLEPLTSQLSAPGLQSLNVIANRLSGPLPTLRATYPALTTLLASDNKFVSISANSLRGLRAVNLASNSVEQLPAEVGLLWHEGLRSLEVGSNAFRMPNYRILDKGTEATMRWLRDKLPASPDGQINGRNDEVD